MESTKELKKIIKENLEKLREEKTLTRKQFAEENGITLVRYSNWMKNNSDAPMVPLEFLIGLAKRYNLDLNKFCGVAISGEKKKHNPPSNGSNEKEAINFLKDINRFIPLVVLGMMGDYYERLTFNLYKDDDVIEYINNIRMKGKSDKIIKRKSILEILTSELKKEQRDLFIGSLLKYLAQLVSIDGEVTPAEKFFFDKILRYNKKRKNSFNLSEEDEEEAKNILYSESHGVLNKKSEYFHNKSNLQLNACFENSVIQKLVVWVLMMVGACDGEISYLEKEYIRRVSRHLGMGTGKLEEIFEQVFSVIKPKPESV